jgi:predicted aldo/keto reductase-like oxidoreductase
MNKIDAQLNSEKIMLEISDMITQGVPYIDAVCEYCEKNSLEIEVIGEIIRRSPILKAKIYDEAEELNLVEKQVRLPI